MFPAIWHQTAPAQTVECIHNDVTVGGVGGYAERGVAVEDGGTDLECSRPSCRRGGVTDFLVLNGGGTQ